jgi:hypothetical protein
MIKLRGKDQKDTLNLFILDMLQQVIFHHQGILYRQLTVVHRTEII